MGLVGFVEALEVVLVRLGEGNNQQGCSDDHLGTGILELAAHHPGCNKSKGSPHIGFLGKLGFVHMRTDKCFMARYRDDSTIGAMIIVCVLAWSIVSMTTWLA